MQQVDITVTSAGSFPVHIPGRYIKYLSGSNGGGDTSLIVTPGAKGGNKIVLQVGQAYRVSDSAPQPDSWTLQNSAGGATILGKVVIGDGRIDDNTFSGIVQTVDGGKVRTLAGSAMIGVGASAQLAAQYSRVQLWNPAGSGVRAVVEGVLGNTPAAQIIQWSFNTTQLTTLCQAGQAKKAGGANGALGIYTDTSASLPPAVNLFNTALPSSSTFPEKLNEPIILPPGYGLVAWSNAVNSPFAATFEWYEEPNV
ncbi:hypothetical protein [Paraburkholderia nemoris]|uniref:hypothetical protein n=1 Tax=Paraburkholderia nemoris TaxID=2793076 RepID=UPI001B2739FC|nr:hypothetical protein [Paraburkholderia nemoris]CAE6821875.1 hypothetical protein R75777_06189 [Paraburkholderia nemoris]